MPTEVFDLAWPSLLRAGCFTYLLPVVVVPRRASHSHRSRSDVAPNVPYCTDSALVGFGQSSCQAASYTMLAC